MKRWNVRYPDRFDLGTQDDYLKWRDEKLAAYPKNVGELVVELGDMAAITPPPMVVRVHSAPERLASGP